MSKARTAAEREQLFRRTRAAKIAIETNDINLTYMTENGDYYPRRKFAFGDAVDRYMVINYTDGGTDGWADFMPTARDVARFILELVDDEWFAGPVFDLDAEIPHQILPFSVQVLFGGVTSMQVHNPDEIEPTEVRQHLIGHYTEPFHKPPTPE